MGKCVLFLKRLNRNIFARQIIDIKIYIDKHKPKGRQK